MIAEPLGRRQAMKTMNVMLLVAALALAACATPQTVLKNPKTEEIEVCGGSSTGSVLGGMIGKAIQEDNDRKCVKELKDNGFIIIKRQE